MLFCVISIANFCGFISFNFDIISANFEYDKWVLLQFKLQFFTWNLSRFKSGTIIRCTRPNRPSLWVIFCIRALPVNFFLGWYIILGLAAPLDPNSNPIQACEEYFLCAGRIRHWFRSTDIELQWKMMFARIYVLLFNLFFQGLTLIMLLNHT